MLKKFFKKTFVLLGGSVVLRKTNQTPRILFWHGVDEQPDPIVEAESISKSDFLKQINYLHKYFEIISIDEFYSRYTNSTLVGKEIVLTFDDGYKNNLTVLAPLLKERNIPFTVFISAKNISEGTLFPTSILRLVIYGASIPKLSIPSLDMEFDLSTNEEKNRAYYIINKYVKESMLEKVNLICTELINSVDKEKWKDIVNKHQSVKPLTWDEVRELEGDGCTIGSHCIDHICCHSNQNEDEIINQISNSKLDIEKELGIECNYFAYPNGDFTGFSNKCVSNAGYLMGFSTKRERIELNKNEIQAIPRISVPYNIDTFKIILNLHPRK